MTAPAPVPDDTTPPAQAVEAVMKATEGILVTIGGTDYAGDDTWLAGTLDREDRREIAAAVVAALDLPGRDRETAAKALDEAAEAFQSADHATRFILQPAKWLRDRASALREGRDGRG